MNFFYYSGFCKASVLLIVLLFCVDPAFSSNDVGRNDKPSRNIKRTNDTPDAVCDCSDAKLREVRAEANKNLSTVTIDCNLTLERRYIITKRLIFQGPSANNITLNCNGATINGGRNTYNYQYRDSLDMIEINSISNDGGATWQRPSNIRICNCKIIGSVHIGGMSRRSGMRASRRADYVRLIRDNTPTRIQFDSVTLTGIGGDLFYFGSGVTDSELTNSILQGKSEGVPLYLDAESARIKVANNRFEITTGGREMIAVDGSEYNKIMNNTFIRPYKGGIFLYRNCGELGTIRHTTPSHNEIINNVFMYDIFPNGGKKAVFIGSRNADHWGCNDDAGYPYGSSLSDQDHACSNAVVQNQFVNRSPDDMIKIGGDFRNKDNYVDLNTEEREPVNRPAGCFVEQGYKKFIANGETINVFFKNGKLVCNGSVYSCNNGQQQRHADHSGCQIIELPFDLRVEGDNNGEEKIVGCTEGKKIVGVWMACHLENPDFKAGQLVSAPTNTIEVKRASDNPLQGSCWIGDNKESAFKRPILRVVDEKMIKIGCKEHDGNGGDCRVRGVLYCR